MTPRSSRSTASCSVPEELGKSSYIRIVSLWIHPGQEAEFEAYERDAARIMARHGGRIERAIRTSGHGVDAPFEVHIVSFPSRAAADSHANDPDATALRQRRAEIIARTEIIEGREAGPY